MRTLNRALSVLLALTLAVFRVLVVAEIIRAGLERRGGHRFCPSSRSPGSGGTTPGTAAR